MKQREVNRWVKKEYDSSGEPYCLIPPCKVPPMKYKNGNYTNYCQDHGWLDMRAYTNWPELRIKAFKRDNYCCKSCNLRKTSFELIGDHIIPIAIGGEEWDIDNVQTLCQDCNKVKTKKDMGEIAKARQIEKSLHYNTQLL